MSHKFCILCLKIRISFHFPSSEFPAKPTEKITTLIKFNGVSFLAFNFFALNFSVQYNFILRTQNWHFVDQCESDKFEFHLN